MSNLAHNISKVTQQTSHLTHGHKTLNIIDHPIIPKDHIQGFSKIHPFHGHSIMLEYQHKSELREYLQ
jgi:hypothetical protein